jgi:hypothetical protein
MHIKNPGGATGLQMVEPSGQATGGALRQERAKVFHFGGVCSGGCKGEGPQPPSFIESGPTVSDWTHLRPEHSLPDGMDAFESQVPAQPLAGSKVVCGVEEPFWAHVAAFAVMLAGREQDPVGGAHEHVPQSIGASTSAWPS